jgi:hypothetical protein
MVQKLISLSQNEDQILQKISSNLGISETDLIHKILSDYLANQEEDLEFEEFRKQTIALSRKHRFSEDYCFNRDELYEERHT